jgi:hypothetical protein
MAAACVVPVLLIATLGGCGLARMTTKVAVKTTKVAVKATVWGVKGTAKVVQAGAKAVAAPFQSEPVPTSDALGPVSELPAGPTGNVPRTRIAAGGDDDTIEL